MNFILKGLNLIFKEINFIKKKFNFEFKNLTSNKNSCHSVKKNVFKLKHRDFITKRLISKIQKSFSHTDFFLSRTHNLSLKCKNSHSETFHVSYTFSLFISLSHCHPHVLSLRQINSLSDTYSIYLSVSHTL